MIQISELKESFKDAKDFNEYATEALSDFTSTLGGDCVEIYDPEIHGVIEGVGFLFTEKGMKEIKSYECNLINIGIKYFDESDLHINNYSIIEP